MPLFSIILPTYNRAHFLPKAIESVLSQTYEDWELVIVDDGSIDNTKEVVTSFRDPRIIYIYQENQERSAARNTGISHAKGEYICFLDSDDYYLPEKLQNLKQQIEQNEEKSVVLYDGLILEWNGEKREMPFPSQKELSLPDFVISNTLFSQQICGKRDIFLTHQFNPLIRIGEDMELWLRISEEFSFHPVEGSFKTVIVEHEDRSINLKKANAAQEQLNSLQFIFSTPTGKKVSRIVRKRVLSNCMFNIAKYYMYSSNITKSFFWILKSIIKDLRNDQFKHRIYCLMCLLTFRIPDEYKIKTK